jgi:hypothetical protein
VPLPGESESLQVPYLDVPPYQNAEQLVVEMGPIQVERLPSVARFDYQLRV